MQGFTTARDMGGPTCGLKRAIDEGVIPGPRIYPSGAMISQTSGHGDFRRVTDLPRTDGDLDLSERYGFAAIADGTDEVLRRTREQLFQGASQIKVMAGGGVSSDHDPLDSAQYTDAELHAAVRAEHAPVLASDADESVLELGRKNARRARTKITFERRGLSDVRLEGRVREQGVEQLLNRSRPHRQAEQGRAAGRAEEDFKRFQERRRKVLESIAVGQHEAS